jgi:signal transduction histidine kinase
MLNIDILSRIRRSPFALPLAALAALAMIFISETSYRQATTTLDELGAMAQARMNIQGLLRHMVDAETGQRGYLLTQRKDYLKPYSEALDDIQSALRSLEEHYAQEPVPAKTLARLRGLVEGKMSELKETIRVFDEGKPEVAKTLLMTDIGKEQMESIRVLSEQLLAFESAKVGVARKDVYDTLQLNRIGVAAMTAISLLALFMYLRQTHALEMHRKEQQRLLQAEAERLENEVRKRTQQLTELAQHLQTAREDERSRLARDLHDELGALLTAAKLDAARLKSRLGVLTPEAAERLTHLNETLNSGIALKRRIIEDLRPSSLSNLGLVAALEIQAREFADRSGLVVELSLDKVRLKPSSELMVYRLVQEAFTNIAKYARAKRIEVKLWTENTRVHVSVRDDGVGFDTRLPRTSAHGLVGMRYRVEAEGGVMTLSSAPGQGTRVDATLPQASLAAASPNEGILGATIAAAH